MSAKNVEQRVTLWTMRVVPLSEVLRRARGDRSLREMARRTGISVMAIKALEDGSTEIPRKETLPALAEAYGVSEETLARATYGLYVEKEPDSLQRNPAALATA